MGTGLGIFLLVVGAILSFAVRDKVPNVDLAMIGYILMAAGVLSILFNLFGAGRRSSRTEVSEVVSHTQVPTAPAAPAAPPTPQAGPVVETREYVEQRDVPPVDPRI